MTYEYRCPNCDYIREVEAPIGQAPDVADCPQCFQKMRRVMSRFYFGGLNDNVKKKMIKDEKNGKAYEQSVAEHVAEGKEIEKIDEEMHHDFAHVRNSGGRPAGYYPDD